MIDFLRQRRERRKAAVNTDRREAVRMIGCAIASDGPFMAGRGGWMESYGAGVWLGGAKQNASLLEKLHRHAGIFPQTHDQLGAFSRVYLEALSSADMLGLLQSPYEGWLLEKSRSRARRCALSDLEPYLDATPWSENLRGRRVLVVHPFSLSIESQYRENRTKLFSDPRVLPEFELAVLKAPQTMCGATSGFNSWNEALADLQDRVQQQAFDVALIGCGAYGLPLAAFVKNRMGKPAVHMGGATQLLFGVSGARWRNNPRFRALMSDSWRAPLEDERPAGWQEIEDGCYW